MRAALLLVAGFVAACAARPPVPPEVAECRANFLGLDTRVDAAGVRNGGAWRVPGFPYLRSDRFLASFRDAPDGAPFDAWVERLRQLDLASRRSELRNLGWPDPREELAHLDRCGREWAARDLADPRRRATLREHAVVPDDYSLLRRTLGFYPLAVPFLNLGIDDFNDEVRADYATPLRALSSSGPRVLWQPERGRVPVPEATAWLATARADPLGIPRLGDAQWEALARAHLPLWLIETEGAFDAPGAVVIREGAPSVDVARPVTYFRGAYTRFGNEVLAQLVYVVWFSERPKEGAFDSYAGALDGIVWRVTLDARGRPLLYDTIHPCGCYHYYYTAPRAPGAPTLQRRAQESFWQEPVLFPQEPAPAEPFAIRIQARTHYVRRLVPLAEVEAARTSTYTLAAYDALLTLDDGAGATRSLFRADGLAEGTERLERLWLWPAGIASPGAMRQWGRQPTSFVGRSHFDEPRMLERLFEPPVP